MSGSIGGVGNTINGYGDGLKRSMSADGPVSSGAQKKTAVKPSVPQAKRSGAVGSTIGPQKKPTAQQRPQQALAGKSKQQTTARGVAGVAQSRPGTARTAAAGRTPVGASKHSSNTQSKSTADGKIRISPESRPKPGAARIAARTATPAARKHSGADPLGIGKDFGDASKTRPKTGGGSKAPPAPARKPTAGDPLALGDEIGKIGRKK